MCEFAPCSVCHQRKNIHVRHETSTGVTSAGEFVLGEHKALTKFSDSLEVIHKIYRHLTISKPVIIKRGDNGLFPEHLPREVTLAGYALFAGKLNKYLSVNHFSKKWLIGGAIGGGTGVGLTCVGVAAVALAPETFGLSLVVAFGVLLLGSVIVGGTLGLAPVHAIAAYNMITEQPLKTLVSKSRQEVKQPFYVAVINDKELHLFPLP
eukprot:TRINITY_DN1376_c0_g1_i4.p1 TRINITY_DN1376_c0_g1~~TRINITY_DN1376_c0_g1_i4.p1  ORF type:complete len:208 (-),score=17.36 TRINITY_DN1376_c0_g1_i4:100-723(-)